jgi:hypothetical protein
VAVDQPPVWLDEIDPAPGLPFLRMGTRALARDGDGRAVRRPLLAWLAER